MSQRLLQLVGELNERLSLLEKQRELDILTQRALDLRAVGDKERIPDFEMRIRQCENEIRMIKARMSKKSPNNEGT